MQFSQAKTDYLNWLKHEIKKADTTHRTYQSWLNRYERWLADNGFPEPDLEAALSTSILRRYQYSLDKLGLVPNTIRAAFHPIRGLGEFLINQAGLLDENPVKKLTMPKKNEGRRLTMCDKEAVDLLDAAGRQCDPRKVAMSIALVTALLYTGVRANELVHIKVEDVSLEREELLVSTAKGGKMRTLFPAPEFFVAVRAWLREREKIKCDHPWLWAQGPRQGISYDWLLKHLEGLKAVAGYRGAANIKPHSIRHWFATNLYRQTGNVKIVQRALGHSNPQTTYTYLHLDDEECRAMSTMTLGKPKAEATVNSAREDAPTQPRRSGRVPAARTDTRARAVLQRRGGTQQAVRAR